MLVLRPGEVVDTANVSPVEGRGDFAVEVSPGDGFRVHNSVLVVLGVLLEASTLDDDILFLEERSSVDELLGSREMSFDGLGEISLDALGKDFEIGGAGVSDASGPGVSGDSPGAGRFKTGLVRTSHDSEETVFTPPGTPGVSDDPVRNAFFVVGGSSFTPADN